MAVIVYVTALSVKPASLVYYLPRANRKKLKKIKPKQRPDAMCMQDESCMDGVISGMARRNTQNTANRKASSQQAT